MAIQISINFASSNGLLPDNTNQLPELMLTYHHQEHAELPYANDLYWVYMIIF